MDPERETDKVVLSWNPDEVYEYTLDFLKARAYDELAKKLPTRQDVANVRELTYQIRRRLIDAEGDLNEALASVVDKYIELS